MVWFGFKAKKLNRTETEPHPLLFVREICVRIEFGWRCVESVVGNLDVSKYDS